jgi:hypothetical protein
MVDNINANSRLSNLLFVRDRGSIIEEPAALLVICVILLLSRVVPEPNWASVSAPPVFGFTGHLCSAKTKGKWPRIKGDCSLIHIFKCHIMDKDCDASPRSLGGVGTGKAATTPSFAVEGLLWAAIGRLG